MFTRRSKLELHNALAQAAAISRSQAVIEFNLDGTIITANENFLSTIGYALDEIKGKHHSLFVDQTMRESSAYHEFWDKLRKGQFQAAQYRRIAKGGREIWIEASYNPILDSNGKPYKVVKFATDITASKMASLDAQGKIAAIDRAQAVIEFNLDGTIITANEIFLATVGYTLSEIEGRHHSMFVEPHEHRSNAYRDFWARLARGEYQAAEYKRVCKGGKEIWILATYIRSSTTRESLSRL
jgi:methyl-accepting chemotaxis protein